MSAGSFDFTIKRGNSGSILFRCKNGDDAFDLSGSEMVFRATHRGIEVLRKTTADDGLLMPSPTSGEVTLAYDFEESRLFSVGRLNRYELERRIDGNERTLIEGYITGEDGVNDDEEVEP